MSAVKLKLPKVNSSLGMKVIALMLSGAIKTAMMISTTPLPGAPTVSFSYRQYLYGAGCRIAIQMVAEDAEPRRRVLDRFEPSGRGNSLRPVCSCIILVLG